MDNHLPILSSINIKNSELRLEKNLNLDVWPELINMTIHKENNKKLPFI